MMSKKFAVGLMSIFLLMSFGACAGLTHHRDEAVVKSIRKIAVVGFTVDEPAAAQLSLNVGSGKLSGESGGSIIEKQAPHIDEMYQSLSKAFGKNMKWKVMPSSEMIQHTAYQAAYKETMTGWQNKMPAGKGRQRYRIEKIMDDQCLRIMGAEGRTKLIKALGVDAIVTATVNVHLHGTAVMGIGNRYPQSRLSFWLYTPGKDSPDWFEGAVDGVKSETSVGATAFIDEKLLGRLALESARTAFVKIGSKQN